MLNLEISHKNQRRKYLVLDKQGKKEIKPNDSHTMHKLDELG